MSAMSTPSAPAPDERPLLDDLTRDERDEGWGDHDGEDARIRQLREDVPPHHGD